MLLETGARLGPYEVVAPLGAGGMGEVYRARDTRLNRTVALKIVSPAWSNSDPGRYRFEREARVISQINHPKQLQGSRVDARADVFALGAILYEMATGRRAFAATSQAGIIAAVLEQPPPPPSSISTGLSPLLDRVVAQCLAKDPDARPEVIRKWRPSGGHSTRRARQ